MLSRVLNKTMGSITSTLRHKKNADASTELWRLWDSPKFHINMLGKNGMTPLILAIQYNPGLIQKLINNKELDVNIEDYTGRTALMHLIDSRATMDNINLARKIILHSSYKPNAIHEVKDNRLCSCGVTSCTDLMYAIINKRDDIADILLALFATDVNVEDSDGHTALTHVLHRGFFYLESRTTMVWKLVQHNSYQVNKYHSDGTIDITNTVKFSKFKAGHDEVLGVLLLQPGVDINLRDHTGDTVYEMGLESNDFGLLEQLIRNPALEKKVLNTVDLAGKNLLHLILLEYINKTEKENRYENMDNFAAEVLSYPHLNASAKDIEGKSPLVYILNSPEGRIPVDVIKKVIFHPKYQPNQMYYDGYVDILRAAQKLPSPPAVSVLLFLLDIEHLDVMVADTKGTILRYVQRAIADSTTTNTKVIAELKEVLKKLIKHVSYDVNKDFKGKCSDVIWAAANGYWDLAEELLQLPNVEANIRISSCTDVKEGKSFSQSKCTKGMTVMHMACKYGDKNLPLVCKLLQNDQIDVNVQDSDGCTCLMYAVRYQSLYAVQAVLSHPSGCNINLKNNKGETVLDIVQKSTDNSSDKIDPMIVSLIKQGEKFVNTKGVKQWALEASKSMDCLLSDDLDLRIEPCKSLDLLDVSLDSVDATKKEEGCRRRVKQETSQSMTVSELHHRKLLGNQSYLCEHLSPQEVLHHFGKIHILDKDAISDILSAGVRRNIVLKLLSLLLKSSSVFYMQFLGALKLTGQGYIAEELEAFNPVDLMS